MQPSIWQILIVAALVLILFGRGRISEMMGDVGKGIKSFKKGISEEEENAKISAQIDNKPADIRADKATTSDKTAG
ncbi:twin-arginine translocase TatA/TatE family subunit [Parasphingorhabdus sp. JC815]|uniref:twin-arginine translocase TatA/TatE family subunit n=1 Tax=Parasphingorhabdus sp. JC815 TaxID=3232140 RepID=UPI00345A691D